MTDPTPEIESVLAVDIGSAQTRALLFDVVEGQYRYLASGSAPTTIGSPFFEVGEGVFHAIKHLQEITGRNLLENEGSQIIMPTQPGGIGVDCMVMTISAGKKVNIATVGLLSDVSLKSAQRLAAAISGDAVENIGMDDHRPLESQVYSILSSEPDVIILSGGTEYGATRSVFKNAELVSLACRLLPKSKRPVVLYSGNQNLASRIKDGLEKWTSVVAGSNIRPSIDIEDLSPSQERLAEVVGRIRSQQIGGLKELGVRSATPVLPTSYTYGRMIKYLGQTSAQNKGAMGVDLGATSTTIAAADLDSFGMSVLPVGLGSTLPKLLNHCQVAEISRWLTLPVTDDTLLDYIYQKSLYPNSIPSTDETLAIEQALARQILQAALSKARQHWPEIGDSHEPILAGGAILSKVPTRGQSLLVLLDGIQPVGVTTVILDSNGLLSSLGAIARINALLPVQVLDSGAFLNLGCVIAPLCNQRLGTVVLRLRMEAEDGSLSVSTDIRQGEIRTFKLRSGQVARLRLEPLRGTQIDLLRKPGKVDIKVFGGECGVVIDARGRPLNLSKDAVQRREQLQQWEEAIKT